MTRPDAPGTLFVVATPIGNLEDITLRALRILKEVSIVAAEDTRVFAKLAARHDISTRVVSIRGKAARPHFTKLLERLAAGDDVALVSDAGTPSVSDPGFELVSDAVARGIRVSPVPGASALAAAVSVAGLRGEGVRFWGFLPRAGRRRRDLMDAVAYERGLSVIYESPRRTGQTLAELAERCGQGNAAVLRELTKLHEEVVRGTLTSLAERFSEQHTRGEVVLVIEGMGQSDAEPFSEAHLRDAVKNEIRAGRTTKDIVAALAGGFGVSRKIVYQIALEELAAHRER
jgi:16S rRNA (cytidine1402-2'-O)-methyltransferase